MMPTCGRAPDIRLFHHEGDDDGHNLLSPGANTHDNLQFLVFCTAVIRAVNKFQGLLRASIASEPGADDRFLREARLATRINHPNVVAIDNGGLTAVLVVNDPDVVVGERGDGDNRWHGGIFDSAGQLWRVSVKPTAPYTDLDGEQLIEWGDKMIGNTDPDLGGLPPASPESDP